MAETLENLIDNPSLETVRHQALHVRKELRAINYLDYPPEAFQMRNMFLCTVEYIVDTLDHIAQATPPDPDLPTRLIAFATIVQKLYSYGRYLRASTPTQSPPAVRLALGLLTNLYRSPHVERPLLLVRPQWKYNLEHVPISAELLGILPVSTLDPEKRLGITEPEKTIQVLWRWWRSRLDPTEQKYVLEEAPQHAAILSFAGLAADDPFFLPVLAHELGHYFDASFKGNLSLELKDRAQISKDDIVDVIGIDAATRDPAQVTRWKRELEKRAYRCIRELLADNLGTRMMGLAFLAAQSENLKTMSAWPESKILQSGYPGIKFRLQQIFRQLSTHHDVLSFVGGPAPEGHEDTHRTLKKYLSGWTTRLAGTEYDEHDYSMSVTEYRLNELVERTAARVVDGVVEAARRVIADENCIRLTPTFYQRIRLLECDLPPILTTETPSALPEILSAAWVYRLRQEQSAPLRQTGIDSYTRTCRLVLKALELLPLVQETSQRSTTVSRAPDPSTRREVGLGGILSRPELSRRVRAPLGDPTRIGIVPLRPDALQSSSIDLRLGNWFSIFKRTKVRSVPLDHAMESELLKAAAREDIFVPFTQRFLIHPGDFVLGVTLEFVALPNDAAAWVEGRSRPGRMGLSVATATQVAPGFHGVLVLELANHGTVPLELEPGIDVAQIVFQQVSDPLPPEELYRGRVLLPDSTMSEVQNVTRRSVRGGAAKS